MGEGQAALNDAELSRQHSILLTALYLRGLDRFAAPKRSLWPSVLSKLRLECASLGSASGVLHRHGFELEALLLSDSKLLDAAEMLNSHSRVLTPIDSTYPSRWLERLGASTPPAVWWNGRSWRACPSITVVGSRLISQEVQEWALGIGSAAAANGYLVVSGGAIGCDQAAIQGALQSGGLNPSGAISILPGGINQYARRNSAVLSVCEPDAPFTSAQAMERNTLLYAASEWAIVAHSRFREGGTWAGCTDALRRRLCRIAVSNQSDEHAADALCALGAKQICGWDDFKSVKALPEAGVLPISYQVSDSFRHCDDKIHEIHRDYAKCLVA